MTTSILFVCLGNICRSPSAEGVARKMAPDLVLDSAGTGGWHAGEAPYAPMQAAALARGYDLSDLRARQFRRADFTKFSLILAMDRSNLADIEAQRPEGNATPLRLFTDYLGPENAHFGTLDVPDPWYTRDFDATLDLIEACTRALLADLGQSARD
jgi:protein-tyrosine phosphatase